ncbi:MAG: redoxin domain-containing protein [Candidatus Poribacteria bacterium]|nr:redoxin domain-containing protein [Candidatus Poribacteria bacterium]MDE0502458.1 redoxin domain-containing protein [Candidatus Poribacteria bacterium]
MIPFISLYGTSEHSIGWLAVLLDSSAKSILVLTLSAGLTLALKRSSAAFRHLIWLLAIVSCLFLPVISLTLPSWRVPVEPQLLPSSGESPDPEGNPDATRLSSPHRQAATPHAPIPQVNPNHQTAGSPHMDQEASESIASQTTGWRSLSILWTCIGAVWVIGMLVVLLPLVAGFIGIRRIAGRSRRITSGSLASLADELVKRRGIKRGFALVQSEMDMPLTWGVMRPLILIPADAEHWSSDKQRAVLLHELAHVRRWDWLTQIIAHICCAIYWFNPLVWVADRRLRLERERACDDHVLTNGCWAADYASHLLEIARSSRPPVFAVRAAVAMAQPSRIEKRLQVILATDRNRRRMKKIPITASALTFASLVLLIGVMRPVKAIEEEELLLKIREGIFPRAEHTEKTLTYAEMEAIVNLPSKRIEYGLELSEQFLSMYPESKVRDEARLCRILFLLGLDKQGRANSEIDSYLVAFPKSKHAPELLSLKIDRFEKDGKYMEALAEVDKITHLAILPRAFEEKARLYSNMKDRVKAAEYRLRTAELTFGKPSPDFTLKDIKGETVALKDFRGKVVLLDFWATTCGPCITELPNLRALYKKHSPNLVLISVSFDADDDTVAKFVEINEMPWIHIRDTMEMAAKFNIGSIPDCRVIDKKGLMRIGNLRGETALNKVIPFLLAEAPRESDSANIAKLYRLRADLHEVRGEREEAIAAYEDAMSLQPNDIQPIKALARLYRDSGGEKALAFHDESLPVLVEADESKTGADITLGEAAFDFAMFYDEQGDAGKCRQAIEIATENAPDGFLAAQIGQMTGRVSGISERSAFKALTADTPETE